MSQAQALGHFSHGSGCETVVVADLWGGACYPRYTVYGVFRYFKQEPLVSHRQMGAALWTRDGLSEMDDLDRSVGQSLWLG